MLPRQERCQTHRPRNSRRAALCALEVYGSAPRTVWALGFVSLFMDISSEMIHALLPLFLVDSLDVGVAAVGLIEGVAEATAAVTKVFSGVLSDRLGRRKLLTALGYGLGAAWSSASAARSPWPASARRSCC